MNTPGQQAESKSEEKFMAEDLPKIHAAVQTARTAKARSSVTIEVAENGGIIAIGVDIRKKFK